MSNGYPMVPLGEVLVQYQEYIEMPEPKMYPKLSVKLYGKGVVLDEPTDGISLKMKRHQIAHSGQVILSEIWGKKGAIGFVPPEGDGALCTSHFFLFDLCEDRVEPEYLRAIFVANYLETQLDADAKGTTGYAAVRPKNLLAAQIPLPPLEEQRRIVARIEELASGIEEARRLRRETVEEVEQILPTVLTTILNADSWPRILLGNILSESSLNGLSLHPSDIAQGFPILRISAATSRADAVIDEADFKYVEVDEKTLSKYKLEPGDLLACRFNGNLHYVGKFALYKGYSNRLHLYPDKLIRFRVDRDKILPEFACYAMNSPMGRKSVEAFCATTAGNIGISATDLKTISLPVPPLPEQRRIVAYLDDLQAKVDALRKLQGETRAELEALLPSVLDRAFRGELV